MTRFYSELRRFVEEESAPTSAEYALLLVFTALVILVVAVTMGDSLRDLFQATAPAIGNSSPPP
jgi:Flp pilus assembly pilin Flp